MISKVLVPVFAFTASLIPSAILLLLIRKYHREKPPGLQTILDLLIIDSVNLFLIFNAVDLVVFLNVTIHLHEHLPLEVNQIENYPDHKVLKDSRIFVGVYASIRFTLSVVQPPVSNTFTKAITGTDDKL